MGDRNEDGQPVARLTVESAGAASGLQADHNTLLTRWRLLGELLRSDSSKAAACVLHSIADRIGKDGRAWPSMRRIAADTGLDCRTVTRAIKSLVLAGYLIRDSGSRTEPNTYRLGMGAAAHTVRAAAPVGASLPVRAELSEGCGQSGPKGVGGAAHVILPENPPIEPTQERASAQRGAGGSLFDVEDVEPTTAAADRFAEFWQAYPRKVAKPRARKAWLRQRADEHADDVLAGVAAWAASAQWRKDAGAFVPHPATFLNDRRWEDPPPAATTASARARLPATAYPDEQQAAEIMRRRNGAL